MNEQDLLTTESGRYFINTSNKIIARSTLSWEDIKSALTDSENIWREWLFEGFLAHFYKHTSDPLCSFKKSTDDDSDDPTFLISLRYGNSVKYRFLLRHFIYFDWMNEKGLVPLNGRGKRRVRFPKEFDVDQALRSLSVSDRTDMWRSIILDEETRIPTSSAYLESSLRYHVDRVRELVKAYSSKEEPLDFLNRIFQENLTPKGEKYQPGVNAAKREKRLSIIRFIVLLAASGKIVLPAKALAMNVKGLSYVFTGFVKGSAILLIVTEN